MGNKESTWSGLTLFRALHGHSLPLLYTDLCLLTVVRRVFLLLGIGVRHLPPPLSSNVSASYLPAIIQNSA